MPTTTELTEKFVSEHPSIKDCLKKGIINYSKLARMIAKELGIGKKTSIEAILIACRRYAEKLKKEKVLEDKIINVLKNSSLEIKNKIIVVTIDKKIYMDNLINIEKKIRKTADIFYAIEGVNVFTIITSEKYLEELRNLFKRNIVKTSKNLAMIILKSPKEIETVPGITAYLYSLFGDHGINIIETMSCWTDTIFVIEEKDIAAVMKLLKF